MRDLFNLNNKKLAARIILYLFLCIVIAGASYVLYGHKIIRDVYEGKSFWFLSRMITSADERPVASYYNEADRRFIMGVAYVAASVFIVAVLLLLDKRARKILITNLIITFILLESIIALMLFFPSLAKFGLSAFIKHLYISECSRIIQFEPRCARYDPELTYTLRPGVFYFSGKKFNNEFRVNSLGVRDTEDSLVAPEVVVLGDSVAMGWGGSTRTRHLRN